MKRQVQTQPDRLWRSLLLCGALCSPLLAHEGYMEPILSVYAVDPANPEISYDNDPTVIGPYIPEEPGVVYPSGSAPTGDFTNPVYALQPQIITDDTPPDSHTPNRSPWGKYHAYDVPYENPTVAGGPYLSSGVPMKFDFGTATSPVEPGYTRVSGDTVYSASTGYGWASPVGARDRGGAPDDLRRDNCLPGPGSAFYVDIPDGNYRVTIIFGDVVNKVTKFNCRMDGMPVIFGKSANPGTWSTDTFKFVVGRDELSPTRLWSDDTSPLPCQTSGRIRFEFSANGSYISHICSVSIEPVADEEWNAKPTIFTASDSTVASYGASPSNGPFPTGTTIMGWGEPLYNHFDGGIEIDNIAQPGRSSRSFVEEGILDTILNRIKPGDYLFVMFAINDSADVLPPAYNNRDTKPESTHKAWTRIYINEARKRGAIPVLVTSQTKCTYDAYGRFYNSVQAYPQADRELGWELDVPVIDLNKYGVDRLTALGPKEDDGDPTTENFPVGTLWYRTNPDGTMNDYIHLSPYGANEYARVVSRIILKTPGLEDLAQHVIAPARPQSGVAARSSY